MSKPFLGLSWWLPVALVCPWGSAGRGQMPASGSQQLPRGRVRLERLAQGACLGGELGGRLEARMAGHRGEITQGD